MASHPEDPWVLVADVLAEVAGVDPSRSFDPEAEALAKTMRGVRFGWDDRPRIRWSAARELRDSLKAEAARRHQAIEEQLVAADAARRAQIPPGIPAGMVPAGITAGQLMMLSDPEARRAHRESMVEHSLRGGGIVFHPVRDEQADQ